MNDSEFMTKLIAAWVKDKKAVTKLLIEWGFKHTRLLGQ